MTKLAFTDRWLRTVRCLKGNDEYIDATCPNLRLRVGRLSKSFSVMIGSTGNRRRVTLGKYPAMSLAEARQMAAATIESPITSSIARRRARYGTVRELFEFVINSMDAEGKSSEANRIYLLEGPLAAIHTFGEATLARNIRPNDEPPRVYRRVIGSNVKLLFQRRSRFRRSSPVTEVILHAADAEGATRRAKHCNPFLRMQSARGPTKGQSIGSAGQ